MKYPPSSTINLPATPRQCRRIALQCGQLGIKEPLEEQVSNRFEARNLIFELRARIKARQR